MPALHLPVTKRHRPEPRSVAAWLAILACAAVLAEPALAQSTPVAPRWAWTGAVTESTAVVKARLPETVSGARLLLSEVVTGTTQPPVLRTVPGEGFKVPDEDGLVAFTLDGLRSATRYRYVVETDAGVALSGTFRTFDDEAFSFRVGFASCASTGSNSPVFDAIRLLSPDLFIHMGDFHYENIARNSPARFRRAYDDVLASPRQSTMYRAMPVVYVWDDHDFGPNDADGQSPSKPAAFTVYRQFVPHYPLGTPNNESVNQAFTIGRVRFIVTDSRSQRTPVYVGTPETRTMLGEPQLEWLERELERAKDFPLVVWVNTVPWITRQRGNTDGWQRYSRERTRIADRIQDLGLAARLVMLSGDAHMVAMDDGTNSNYASGAKPGDRGFPVVHAAPMDRATSLKGGPYTNGVSRRRGQFGFMDVIDDGKIVRVELTGRNIRGEVIPRMRMVLACDGRTCDLVDSAAAAATGSTRE